MMNLINQIPMDVWMAIAGVIITLVVSAAHSRGKRMPILEIILDKVLNKPLPKPDEPKAEHDPNLRDMLQDVLKKLKERDLSKPGL